MDVFVRSMSTRGALGGLSTATTDAVRALDAFGKDKIVIETVGAGQSEVDVVKTADTVAVLVPPASGDDVQMLKAGILEIADVFVVNKADLDGADRTVSELQEMLHLRESDAAATGHHGPALLPDAEESTADDGDEEWLPPIVETVADRGEGVADLLAAFDDHAEFLDESGARERVARQRFREEILTLLRADVHGLLEAEITQQGGLEGYVDRVLARETDPYTVADELLEPIASRFDGSD
jgi:LAO/AO transport system kinase